MAALGHSLVSFGNVFNQSLISSLRGATAGANARMSYPEVVFLVVQSFASLREGMVWQEGLLAQGIDLAVHIESCHPDYYHEN